MFDRTTPRKMLIRLDVAELLSLPRLGLTVLVVGCLCGPLGGRAEAAVAASCENKAGRLDVQAAVNATPAGGTVTIPAGSCIWSVPVTISNKALTIAGAGIGQTEIIGNTPNVSPLQVTTCSANHFFNARGLTWRIQAAGSSAGIISINCGNVAGYPPVAFRLTDMAMYGDPIDGVSSGNRFIMAGAVYGVVDHCFFYSYTARGAGNVSIGRDNGITTSNVYHTPFAFGDQNALYVENNYFYFGVANSGNGAIDNYAGARYVFRFNTVVNNNIGHHGLDSQPRGAATFEIYGNTFIAESAIGAITLIHARSGTGVVWGNTVKNVLPMASYQGYVKFFAPMYYGALTPHALSGNVRLNVRSPLYYPKAPWGGSPYAGTMGPLTDGIGNRATGSNAIDGNQFGPGHMDPDTTRTVTDLVTTAGSKTITSATANFVLATDRPKLLIASNVVGGRDVTDGAWTQGSTIVTSASANFSAGDVGRLIGAGGSAAIPNGTVIASVQNSSTATLSTAATATGTGHLVLAGPHIVDVINSTTAVLNVPATASGTSGSLTLGYTDQGYPLADQPGRGYFPSANAGNWPLVASGYSDSDYQQLIPIYLWRNQWQSVDAGMNVVSSGLPPATTVYLEGSQGYIKRHREYYDDADTSAGTLAARPTTCTPGFAYFATDGGGNWNTTNGPSADGALYRCTAPNVWSHHYTPLSFPHPLAASPLSAPTNLRVVGQ